MHVRVTYHDLPACRRQLIYTELDFVALVLLDDLTKHGLAGE